MPINDDDLDDLARRKHPDKKRPRGTLPYLPEDADLEQLRDWLTLAFRPPAGWRIEAFERAGTRRKHPCALTAVNGREHRKFRFNEQSDLISRMRTSVVSVSSGALRMPHLTPSEVEDVWAALCTLGRVLDEQDEPEEARDWVRRALDVTKTIPGRHTLTRPGRYDTLMLLRAQGEFGMLDAKSILAHPLDPWPRYPVRFVDSLTEETWLRASEIATYLRYIVGVERLSHGTLRGRLAEIGVRWHRFESRRAPHPKITLYRVPVELVAGHEAETQP